MIKIILKANEIDMDVRFFQRNIANRNHVCPLFSISLLVCEFKPYRQTWYQKFVGTYPPLLKPSIVRIPQRLGSYSKVCHIRKQYIRN